MQNWNILCPTSFMSAENFIGWAKRTIFFNESCYPSTTFESRIKNIHFKTKFPVFSLCFAQFSKFPVFSLSGIFNVHIPCFPEWMGTLLCHHYIMVLCTLTRAMKEMWVFTFNIGHGTWDGTGNKFETNLLFVCFWFFIKFIHFTKTYYGEWSWYWGECSYVHVYHVHMYISFPLYIYLSFYNILIYVII